MADRDQEMIARVRRTIQAFSDGDFDKAVEHAHPDVELVRPGGQSPVRGIAALRAWMEPDALEDQRSEILDHWVIGNRVLVRQHGTARGAGSGIEMEIDSWGVWTFDDEGLVTRVEFYLQHEEAEARRAAGLEG